MKKNEIQVGGTYTAKVSGKLTTVRVDAVREISGYRGSSFPYGIGGRASPDRTVYDVTNLATGRRTTFRSAMKFRRAVDSKGRSANDKAMMEAFGCPNPDSDLPKGEISLLETR